MENKQRKTIEAIDRRILRAQRAYFEARARNKGARRIERARRRRDRALDDWKEWRRTK